MPKYLAVCLGTLLAGLTAPCVGQMNATGQTHVAATQLATNARAHDLTMLRECGEVCGKLSTSAEATFERSKGGWRINAVRLFYMADTEPAKVESDLRELARLTSLESVAVAGTYGSSTCKLAEEGMRALEPLKHLRKLSMYRLSSRIDLKALADLPELEDLDLSDCSEDSSTNDLVHLKDLAKLRKLNLAGRNLTDAALDHVGPLKGLEVLDLDDNGTVTDAGLAKLKGLVNLRELSLDLVNITDAGLAEISGLRNLRVLRMHGYVPGEAGMAKFTGKGLSALGGLANLRDLSIGSVDLTPNDLWVLKSLPHLERLAIFGRVNDVQGKLDLSFLTGLKELDIHLDVGKAEFVFPAGLQRIDFSVEQTRWESYQPSLARLPNVVIRTHLQDGTKAMPLLRSLPNPVELDSYLLERDDFAKAFVDAAPKSLRCLSVAVCDSRRFTAASLIALAQLEQLKSLEIPYYGKYSGPGIAELARLKNLRRLRLDNLTAEGFARVADLKELRWLALSANRPDKNSVTSIDPGLAGWKALGKLEDLSISNAGLTDEGLKHLAKLKNLRALDLTGCSGYTDAGLCSLMQALPELKTVKRFWACSLKIVTPSAQPAAIQPALLTFRLPLEEESSEEATRSRHDRYSALFQPKNHTWRFLSKGTEYKPVRVKFVIMAFGEQCRCVFGCFVSDAYDRAGFSYDSRSAKGFGYGRISDVQAARIDKLMASLPPEPPQVPTDRQLLVSVPQGQEWKVRIYDQANLPVEVLELSRLSGAGIGTRVVTVNPKSELDSSRANGLSKGGLALSPDGRTLVGGGANNVLKAWDAESFKPVNTFSGAPELGTVGLAFSPDGKYLAVAEWGKVVVLNAKSGAIVTTLTLPKDVLLRGVSFTPDGRFLIAHRYEAFIYSVADWQIVQQLPDAPQRALRCFQSRDGKWAVINDADGTLLLWDMAAKKAKATLDAGHYPSLVAFSPDQMRVAVATTKPLDIDDVNAECHIRVWDVKTAKLVCELKPFDIGDLSPVEGLLWSPDGNYVLAGARTGDFFTSRSVMVWNVSTGRHRGAFDGPPCKLTGMALTPDGKTLIAGSKDNKIRLWDFEAGMKRIQAFEATLPTLPHEPRRPVAIAIPAAVRSVDSPATQPAPSAGSGPSTQPGGTAQEAGGVSVTITKTGYVFDGRTYGPADANAVVAGMKAAAGSPPVPVEVFYGPDIEKESRVYKLLNLLMAAGLNDVNAGPQPAAEDEDLLAYARRNKLVACCYEPDEKEFFDSDLKRAVERLKQFQQPWTLKNVLAWYNQAKDAKTRADLLTVLAASRHPKAALELGAALTDEELDVRVAATYALMHYYLGSLVPGGTEQHMDAAAKWWAKNRPRLIAATRPRMPTR